MGLTNWMVQRSLQKQAEKTVKWAADTYSEVKAQNEGLSEQEIFLKMLPGGDGRSELPDSTRHLVNECSQSIEGVCYLALEIADVTKGLMNFRYLQLTTYIDRALYARGFKRQSRAVKTRILSALHFPLEIWEKYADEA